MGSLMNYNWFWIFANTKAPLQCTGFKFELDFEQECVTRSFADFNCYMSTYTAFERALWRKTIDCRYLHTGKKDTPLTKYNLSKAIFFVVHLESKAGSAGMIDIYVCTLYIEVGCLNFGQVLDESPTCNPFRWHSYTLVVFSNKCLATTLNVKKGMALQYELSHYLFNFVIIFFFWTCLV